MLLMLLFGSCLIKNTTKIIELSMGIFTEYWNKTIETKILEFNTDQASLKIRLAGVLQVHVQCVIIQII